MPFVCFLLSAIVGADALVPEDRNPITNVETYRVIGSEFPGLYKHPASITELDNGDLYIAYYGGSDEYGDDTAVYGMRLVKGATQWTTPVVIADTPDHGEGNPVVWQGPDGTVWLFYNNLYGPTWSNARVMAKKSHDGAQSWTDSWVLCFEEGSMVRGQPIVLNSGEYFLPVYHETGEDREGTIPSTMSYFLRYNPQTKLWSETGRIKSEMGNLQAQVVQMTNTHLIAYIRRGGNFLPTKDGYTLRSESHDGGNSWSDAVKSQFLNPNSAVDFIKLQNGHLLLVYNDNMDERTPLTVTISTDGDKTWPYKRHIGGGDNTFAYPYAIQTKDELIHIIYTANRRTTIMHSVFHEDAITNWPPKE